VEDVIVKKHVLLTGLVLTLFAPTFLLADSIVPEEFQWLCAAYSDVRYPTCWAYGGLINNFRNAGYEILDADELKTWMDARIADGKPSVIVFCKDIVPDTVAESMSSSCTLRQYLNSGGKIVWYGDIPMYYQGHSDGSRTEWTWDGSIAVLGFNAISGMWDSGDEVTFTSEGISWGLTQTWPSWRSTSPSGLRVLAEDNSGYATAWVKHYVPDDGYRGFVRLFDDIGEPNFNDVRNLAEYCPFRTSKPHPSDGEIILTLDPNVTLSWSPGEGAVSHNVYLGTDFNDIKDANTADPDIYMGNYDVNSYDPCGLEFYTTYYWRIDEVIDSDTTWKGDIWSFTIVSDPNFPADGTIDANTVYQQLEGFGASGAFYENWLTAHPQKETLYDLFFDDLGIDIYRLRNTYDQATGGSDYMNRSRDIVAAAKLRNPEIKIMISSWSPPAYLKSNANLASGTLLKDVNGNYMYDEFANWWADSLGAWSALGVDVEYLNIQNEPEIEVDYDSCRFDPVENYDYAGYDQAYETVYNELYSRMGPNMPKMLATDSAGLAFCVYYLDSLIDDSHAYGFSHHLYTDGSADYPDSFISAMDGFASEYGYKPLFQTEYFKQIELPQTYTFTDAINLAILLHNSLTVEEVASYLYWELFWEQPKGLISFPSYGNTGYTINRVFYAMKHFSAFTDPGWHRIDASLSGIGAGNLRLSAYKSPDERQLTAVIINTSNVTDVNLNLSFTGFTIGGGKVYRSAQTQNCVLLDDYNGGQIILPAYSITTMALGNLDYYEPPAIPTGLTATAESERVVLDWDDNTEEDFIGYNLYRSLTSGSGYEKLNGTLLTDSNYIDYDVIPGTTYYYATTAVDNLSNESAYSDEVFATAIDTTAPAVPLNLVAVPGDATVLLQWDGNSEEDFAGYNIYRSTHTGESYQKINTSLLTGPVYTDNNVVNGTIYYYVVTALDLVSNESAGSNEIAAQPGLPDTIYNFVGITAADVNYNAYACDVDVFPFLGLSGNRNSMVEATNLQYTAVSAIDEDRWATVNPSIGDEIFIWVEMKINELVNEIGKIEFTFNGYTEGSGPVAHNLYVLKAGADWTLNNSWVQLGTASVTAGTDGTLTGFIGPDIQTFIDESGKITWGVSETVSVQIMHINYLQAAVYLSAVDYNTCTDIQSAGLRLDSDLNGDCYVNLEDLEVLAGYWLNNDCGALNNCDNADFAPTDGDVDFADYSDFAGQWFNCNNPQDANCPQNW
jgi:glucuronoarabinoxylan endo-1,4-beta-xylanase